MNQSLAENLQELQGRSVSISERQPLVRRSLHRKKVLHHRTMTVSPMAILGFVLTAVMVCAVLYCRILLDHINDQQVAVSNQLETLQTEYQLLAARYEQTFDLDQIETDMVSSGTMAPPTVAQQVYMDLSRPDSAVTFDE